MGSAELRTWHLPEAEEDVRDGLRRQLQGAALSGVVGHSLAFPRRGNGKEGNLSSLARQADVPDAAIGPGVLQAQRRINPARPAHLQVIGRLRNRDRM